MAGRGQQLAEQLLLARPQLASQRTPQTQTEDALEQFERKSSQHLPTLMRIDLMLDPLVPQCVARASQSCPIGRAVHTLSDLRRQLGDQIKEGSILQRQCNQLPEKVSLPEQRKHRRRVGDILVKSNRVGMNRLQVRGTQAIEDSVRGLVGNDVVTESGLDRRLSALDRPSFPINKVAEVKCLGLPAVERVRVVHPLRQNAQAASLKRPWHFASEHDRILKELKGVDGRGPRVDLRLLARVRRGREVVEILAAPFAPVLDPLAPCSRGIHAIGRGVVVDNHKSRRCRTRRDARVAADDSFADWILIAFG